MIAIPIDFIVAIRSNYPWCEGPDLNVSKTQSLFSILPNPADTCSIRVMAPKNLSEFAFVRDPSHWFFHDFRRCCRISLGFIGIANKNSIRKVQPSKTEIVKYGGKRSSTSAGMPPTGASAAPS